MKKVVSLLLLLVVVSLVGCTAGKETIEGYWMTETGETISFNSDGKAIVGSITKDYSVYGDNNLSITFLGISTEYRYSVKRDVLTLVDLKKNTTTLYYRNEKKQAEILENLKKQQEEKMKDIKGKLNELIEN